MNMDRLSHKINHFCKFAIDSSLDSSVNYLCAVHKKYMDMLAKAPPASFDPKSHDEATKVARDYLLSNQNMNIYNQLMKNKENLSPECLEKLKMIEYSIGMAKAFRPTILL